MMKKIIFLFTIFTITSCNDGDFDVPAFEFTETVSTCGQYIFYKTNTEKTETLVIKLSSTEIAKTVGTKSFPISTPIIVTYRLFDAAIGSDYFCQSIPPAKPLVIKELIATSGIINIVTSETTTGYSYAITITDLLFLDAKDRIFYQSFPFGTGTILN
ncbi:hypothetical protein [Lutibacter sp.]|uniref:hypothetical protein n=1 Tax=Lutibacter sp. TaxID=1925666 RepID=UPI0027371B24|nr:hypothetical protein [Lutibacter sp.]MDP3312118.1 hypothetical protein [Lutibacter sp.]